ncbi:hypothetical protein Trydic_g3674 [Trypoxylus dichotomus]
MHLSIDQRAIYPASNQVDESTNYKFQDGDRVRPTVLTGDYSFRRIEVYASRRAAKRAIRSVFEGSAQTSVVAVYSDGFRSGFVRQIVPTVRGELRLCRRFV